MEVMARIAQMVEAVVDRVASLASAVTAAWTPEMAKESAFFLCGVVVTFVVEYRLNFVIVGLVAELTFSVCDVVRRLSIQYIIW